MKRRALLTRLGCLTAVAAAGYTGQLRGTNDGSDTTPAPTPSPDRFSMSRAYLRDAFLSVSGADTATVSSKPDARVLFASVRNSSGATFSEDEFVLRLGNSEVAGETQFDPQSRTAFRFVDDGGGVHATCDGVDSGEQWVLFTVPAEQQIETARLTVPGDGDAGWNLDSTIVERVRKPLPTISLSSVSVPESVGSEEPVPVSFELVNDSSFDGVFRAAMNEHGYYNGYYPVSIPVPAGESVSKTVELPNRAPDAEKMEYELKTADNEEQFEVAVTS
ncbi:hypothetical protein [Haloarchaeobius sp. TZWWS8]|uniref:hypothetical protein n=1 Tax=Haloarchaeobius sp. TZWWS8 TaxID=3446121 RepID=UPI003EBE567B